ncbi:putative reverse transcriptase domain-containing protein [Tanacetum coccineum]
MRAEAASTSHSLPLPPPFILSPTRPDVPSLGIPPPLPISVSTSSPPLLLPSASCREDRPEVTLPPRKRLGIALGLGYEVRESSCAAAARPDGGLRADYGFIATMDREIRRNPEREIGYGITDSWDEIVETLQGALVSTDTELVQYMTAFETRVRQDTDEVYTSDLAHAEVMSLRTTVLAQMSEIRELQDADRKRQAVISEMLKAEQRRSAEMREGDSTTRIGDHLAGAGDSPTRTGHSITGIGYRTTGTTGTRWKKWHPKRATRSTSITTTPAPTATTTTTVTNAQLQAMIDQGVTAALAARDATRNGVDSHTSGTGVRGSERVARECTYQDFMKCKPLYFKGTEGVIKFSTCTLLAGALTWWNSHVMTVTHDVAYAMTWVDLRKKMTDKYCPRNEMKKLEAELWNLKVIGTDVVSYVGGLPDMIHGNIVASRPKTMQEAVEMATELMDKRVSTIAERQAENKRKFENTSRNNQNQQQQNKSKTSQHNTAGSVIRNNKGVSKTLSSKCNYHHDGPCAPKTAVGTSAGPADALGQMVKTNMQVNREEESE